MRIWGEMLCRVHAQHPAQRADVVLDGGRRGDGSSNFICRSNAKQFSPFLRLFSHIVQIFACDAIFAFKFPSGWTAFVTALKWAGCVFGLNGAAKQRVAIT